MSVRTRCRPEVEPLESRHLLAVSVNLQGGMLLIQGTKRPDGAFISLDGQNILITTNGRGGGQNRFPLVQVNQILFIGKDGNDQFSNQTPIPVTAQGGRGNDHLEGGTGDD